MAQEWLAAVTARGVTVAVADKKLQVTGSLTDEEQAFVQSNAKAVAALLCPPPQPPLTGREAMRLELEAFFATASPAEAERARRWLRILGGN